MRAVHIGIGHQNDLVIPKLADIKVLMDTGTKGGNHGLNLRIGINLIQAGLFHVQDFASQGQDGLGRAGRASLRIRLRNLPLRCRSHSSPDSYRSSLPAFRAGPYRRERSFFWSDRALFWLPRGHAGPEWISPESPWLP